MVETARKKFELDIRDVKASLGVIESRAVALSRKMEEAAKNNAEEYKKMAGVWVAQLEKMGVAADKLRGKTDDINAKWADKQAAAAAKAAEAFVLPAHAADNLSDRLTRLRGSLQTAANVSLVFGVSLVDIARGAKDAALALVDMARAGEKSAAMADQFTRMGGTTADLEKLRSATKDLVPDATLRQMANMAMSFGISGENLQTFAKIALGASRKLGTSVTKSFEDIVTGTARGSKMILDNLGIMIRPMKEIEEEYKKLNGIVGELTDKQKQLATQQEVIRVSTDNLTAANLQSADSVARLDAAWANLKDRLGVHLVRGFDQLGTGINRLTRVEIPGMTKEFERFQQATKKLGIDKLERSTKALLLVAEDYRIKLEAGEITTERYAEAMSVVVREVGKNEDALRKLEHPVSVLAASQVNAAIKTQESREQWDRWNTSMKAAAGFARDTSKELGSLTEQQGNAADIAEGFLLKIERAKEKGAARQAQIDKAASDKRRAERKRAEEAAEAELQKIRQGARATELAESDKGFNDIIELADLKWGDLQRVESARLAARQEIFAKHFGAVGELASASFEKMQSQTQSAAESAAGFSITGKKDEEKEQHDSFLNRIAQAKDLIKSSEDIAKAEKKKEKSIAASAVGGIRAAADFASSFIESEQSRAFISGLVEVAESTAAFVTGDIAGGAGHALAATQFFVAAGTSGGGGSASGGGGAAAQAPKRAEEREASRNQGMSITVENFGRSLRDEDAKDVGREIARFAELGGRL